MPASSAGASTRVPLLDPEFIRKIDQLALVSRKAIIGRIKGERRSKRRGTSLEFADHRPYVAGDDLRFIDWSIYARMDRLFLKLFEEEEDLHVYILVDLSASMGHGDPEKARYAKVVAAALAYMGLAQGDRVGIGILEGRLRAAFQPVRGRPNIFRMCRFLEEAQAAGDTHLEPAVLDFVIRHARPGLAVLISDLFDREGVENALKLLTARRLETYVLHVLAPDEVLPTVRGDLKLVDAEDADETEVTISAPLLASYHRMLEAFRAECRTLCARRRMSYVATTTAVPFDVLVLDYLRKRGLVR